MIILINLMFFPFSQFTVSNPEDVFGSKLTSHNLLLPTKVTKIPPIPQVNRIMTFIM